MTSDERTLIKIARENAVHRELTQRERDAICTMNAENGWGLTAEELIDLCNQHKEARKSGDEHQMAAIEYRLTDINFHTECELMEDGNYGAVLEEAANW